MVKNLPAMKEIWVRFLDWDDPLEKGMATQPLQYSCLENSMDRGTWRVIVHDIGKSWTQLMTSTFTFIYIYVYIYIYIWLFIYVYVYLYIYMFAFGR